MNIGSFYGAVLPLSFILASGVVWGVLKGIAYAVNGDYRRFKQEAFNIRQEKTLLPHLRRMLREPFAIQQTLIANMQQSEVLPAYVPHTVSSASDIIWLIEIARQDRGLDLSRSHTTAEQQLATAPV